MRRKILITGAAGGMGRACARLLGATGDLILTDVAAGSLEAFVAELEAENYTVLAAHAGDLADEALLASLTGHLSGSEPFVLVHTAGLSPSMASWQSIMAVNLVATEKLLRAVETKLAQGSVAVLIASAAGYMPVMHPEAAAILSEPLADDFMERVGPIVEGIAAAGSPAGATGTSYVLSKQAVLAIVERRAIPWGAKGSRIMSISPGMILTPMGRQEKERTPGAAEMEAAAPAGRAGMPIDIAFAVRFLASAEASFLTGSDLKVDGGSIAVTNLMISGALQPPA